MTDLHREETRKAIRCAIICLAIVGAAVVISSLLSSCQTDVCQYCWVAKGE